MSGSIALTGHPSDSQWVLAVMQFPTNRYLRESWYATQIANFEINDMEQSDRVELDKKTLVLLMDAPPLAELKKLTAEAVKRGVVAGDLLASIYLMHHFSLPEPSIKKAIHVVQKFAKRTPYGDGSPIPCSRKVIRECFRQFESVAHLWAAMRINQAYSFAKEDELLLEKLPQFLEVSAALLEFGKSFIPYRAKPALPILKSNDIWGLPEHVTPRHLKGGPFPDELAELLSDYDAGEYQY